MSQRPKTLGTKRGRKTRVRAPVEPPPTEEDSPQDSQQDSQEDTQEHTQQDTQEQSATQEGDDLSDRIAETGGAKKKRVTREPKVTINDPKAEEAMIEWVKETRVLWDKTCPEYRMTKHEQKLVLWQKKATDLLPGQTLTGKLFHFL